MRTSSLPLPEFLLALETFYYEGKAIMSDAEFDLLKEELTWEGSKVRRRPMDACACM